MKPRHVLLAAGLATAAWLALFADKTPAGGFAGPVSRAPTTDFANGVSSSSTAINSAPGTASVATGKVEREPVILALQERNTAIDGTNTDKAPDRLFNNQSWTPPPPPPPKPPPPPPPSAPPLPFAYLGKKIEDNIWEIYLGRGEQTFVVRAQSVIEGTYRIDAIQPPVLSLTYLPLNQVQTLAIGGLD